MDDIKIEYSILKYISLNLTEFHEILPNRT